MVELGWKRGGRGVSGWREESMWKGWKGWNRWKRGERRIERGKE